MILRLVFLTILLFLYSRNAVLANPTQYGSSGLLHVSTADTLDSANLCIGVWGNCSSKPDTGISTIMPVTITLGIGTFWEAYGTYPNVFLNDETPYSGRGTADVGTKIRFIGQRNSNFKVAVDYHLSRYIDDNQKYNGVTDMGGRLIASLRNDTLGAHLYSGYMSNGKSREVVEGYTPTDISNNNRKAETEFPFGLGVEYQPTSRTKLTMEFTGADVATSTAPMETFLGFQYYITPHLTFNLSYGMGVNDAATWRVLFGLSTCQGVGAYIKPIPVVTRKGEKGARGKEVIKPSKVIPLSPLLIKTPALTTPSSKFEVPVDPDAEEIVIRPYGTVIIAQAPAATPVTLPKIPATLLQPGIAAEAAPVEPVLVEPAPVAAIPVEAVSVEPTIIADKMSPSEYSLTRVSGVTPLYGVRMKDPSAKTAVATPLQIIPGGPVTAYRKFRLPDNLFEFDNAEMTPEVRKSISELAEFIRSDSKWVFLRIDGHTDGVGSVKYNLDLSLKRAVAVANNLITREGIDPARIFVRGMGKSAPIADNSTDEGRQLNRRFEIVFLVHKEQK